MDKDLERAQIKMMDCDILIAAIAMANRKKVLTWDWDDWKYIQQASLKVAAVQPLQIMFAKDLIGKKKK
jgi:predicted nucleic acid-binding protein